MDRTPETGLYNPAEIPSPVPGHGQQSPPNAVRPPATNNPPMPLRNPARGLVSAYELVDPRMVRKGHILYVDGLGLINVLQSRPCYLLDVDTVELTGQDSVSILWLYVDNPNPPQASSVGERDPAEVLIVPKQRKVWRLLPPTGGTT